MTLATPVPANMSGPSIRPARAGDAAGLLRMVEQLARHHGDDPMTNLAVLERDLFGPFPWATSLVAEDGAALLGYAILVRLYNAQFGTRGIDLHHLFVVDTARDAGLGRRLIDAVLMQAQEWGCSFVVVGTHPDNLRAQAFYEGLGFQRAATGFPRFRKELR
jgi:GNAT superfamily N-acetyltransferase